MTGCLALPKYLVSVSLNLVFHICQHKCNAIMALEFRLAFDR